jgi:2-iminobutanoate/2-iminopropanoate deaminase
MTDTIAQRIKTQPDPFEPFRISLGFRVGNLILLSGHASLDDSGNVVGAGDFDAQADRTMHNIGRTLAAAGSGIDKIVKVTIYVTDITNFPKVMELRAKWFKPPWPADTIVEVKSLALPELMIEIEAVALASGELRD